MSNEAKEHNCGHNLVDWDGDGNCITCARDKIANPLGDMFEAMGVKVVDITPRDQSVTETPNTLPTGTQEDDIECEIRDGICFSNQYPKHQCIPQILPDEYFYNPTTTQTEAELRDGVILAIGRGNWERMHPTNRKKLLSLVQSQCNRARIEELETVSFRIKDALSVSNGVRAIVRAHVTDEYIDNRLATLREEKQD